MRGSLAARGIAPLPPAGFFNAPTLSGSNPPLQGKLAAKKDGHSTVFFFGAPAGIYVLLQGKSTGLEAQLLRPSELKACHRQAFLTLRPFRVRIPASRQIDSKKDGQVTVFFFGAPAGIRTPDTLLKRQVLCLLSYWGRLAGMAGLEPTISESKSEVLPLHYIPPSIIYSIAHRDRAFVRPLYYGVGKGTRTLDTRNHNPVL